MKIEGGELFVKGSMVARQYVGVNELGSEWLASGDIGEIDEDGMLTVSGRIRDIIISGGENISPRNVEEAILRLEGVEDAAAVGVTDAQWGEAVAAAVVSGRDAEELISAAREIMAGFQVPKRWLCVDEIPRNQMGKIDRSAVRALFGGSRG
jgi:acyl-CoA synthetase (AMP-forming)/AMP-acid ligase II